MPTNLENVPQLQGVQPDRASDGRVRRPTAKLQAMQGICHTYYVGVLSFDHRDGTSVDVQMIMNKKRLLRSEMVWSKPSGAKIVTESEIRCRKQPNWTCSRLGLLKLRGRLVRQFRPLWTKRCVLFMLHYNMFSLNWLSLSLVQREVCPAL